jgi:hypothetical protein
MYGLREHTGVPWHAVVEVVRENNHSAGRGVLQIIPVQISGLINFPTQKTLGTAQF